MPLSGELQALLRKVLAALIGAALGLVLLSALLIGGFVLLAKAATLGLAPWVGEAGAFGITGAVCFALLGFFFYRMMRTPSRSMGRPAGGRSSPLAAFRRLIVENPWESVLTAFALGITEQSDPRLRQFLVQSGLAFLKAANAMDDGGAENDERPPDTSANDGA
ncbi:hypothetical protein EZI54_03680 [Marinobacter halodurans]|uniref:Uncharacterized protein n=1 Tax=Marinobacter halodurans TaxID=2528979 RepID=A0ABY1ZRK4_9GAMM|nr:hypothetical protein [Marinobacter halodurans]TBW58494.1 hypothetical protein EZI54_03680 [Marinobacter halodurans]